MTKLNTGKTPIHPFVGKHLSNALVLGSPPDFPVRPLVDLLASLYLAQKVTVTHDLNGPTENAKFPPIFTAIAKNPFFGPKFNQFHQS